MKSNSRWASAPSGSMPIAASLVAEIVARATRSPSQPQGVDINSAFRLPYGIKRVRLEPGIARFEF